MTFAAATNSLIAGELTLNMQIQQKEVAAVDQNLDRGVERAKTRRSEADRFGQATQYIYPTMNFFR